MLFQAWGHVGEQDNKVPALMELMLQRERRVINKAKLSKAIPQRSPGAGWWIMEIGGQGRVP